MTCIAIMCSCTFQSLIHDNKELDIIELRGLIKTYEDGQPSIDQETTDKYSNSNYVLSESSLRYLRNYESYENVNITSYVIINRNSEPNSKGVSVSYHVTFRIDKNTNKLIEIDSIEEISIEKQ